MIFNNNVIIIVTSVIILLCVSQLFFIMILSMTRIYCNPNVSYLTDSFVDDLFTKGAIFSFSIAYLLTNPFLCVLLDIYIVADEEENQLALKLHRFVTPE